MDAYTITRALLRASRTHGAAFARDVVRVCGTTSHQATQALRALVAPTATKPANSVTYTVHCKPRCVLQYEAIAFETIHVTEYVDHGDFVEAFVREELVECAPTPPKLIFFPVMYTIETDEPVDVDALLAQDGVCAVTCEIVTSDDAVKEAAISDDDNKEDDIKTPAAEGVHNKDTTDKHEADGQATTHQDPTTTTTTTTTAATTTTTINKADQNSEAAIALVVVLINTPFSGQYELYRVPVEARLIMELTKDYLSSLWSSLWRLCL